MAKENISGSSGVIYNSLTHGSKIIGKIIADKDFRIDGEIEGDIVCSGKIVIGQKGFLKGTVQCTFAEILGKVDGKIEVSDTLTLRESAVVVGDIKTKILIVEPKAVFDGTCSMKREISKAEADMAEISPKKMKELIS
ncbi:polymer-forming cytoskeletal protein [Paludibacter sp. 221]|uniref:bactofilin family protein n=1 Tax=Paludibacter sp. 221 TaxID=2302939 RepID=UPI0013D233F0|nr:polymer-forming cytoskeletal protein [Paludibacter sp. 221]NDV47545.1 polymer-forming cytoskeletal protein [Paludibacter sp. 221]